MKLTQTALCEALEDWLGDKHLQQACHGGQRGRRQKCGESLQDLPADVERLTEK